MQNIIHCANWDPYDLSYFTHFYSPIFHDDAMDFSIIYGAVASAGRPGRASSFVDVRPRLNSLIKK